MLTDKKLEKITKTLGKDKLADLESLSPDSIKNAIVAAENAMKNAQDELENNPNYIEIKENLKVLSAGLRDVRKFQKAVIEYSLALLDSSGA